MLSTSWPGGVISTTTTWTAANSPYILSGSVLVQQGATLTIEVGVQVQGSSLSINGNGTGGALVASGVSFHNSGVNLNKGASASLSGNQFLSNNVAADATLASALVGNTFPANASISLSSGTLTTATTLPLIPNVSGYNLFTQIVSSGATLTIEDGNRITGSGLTVANGGTLVASGVNFQNSAVNLNKGASASLSGNQFLSNNVTADATLASALVGNTFPANASISLSSGTLTTATTLPLIPNVSGYNLFTQVVGSGATLTIEDGNRITGSGLTVANGGALVASGVNFQNSAVNLNKGASASLSGNNFLSNNVAADATLASALVGNTFPANAVINLGSGTLATSATLPFIPNVSGYNLFSQVIGSGATLTIDSGNRLTGSGLTVLNGGTLFASGVNFQNSSLSLNKGASAFLSGNQFLSSNVIVDATLASALVGNSFPANAYISLGSGTLATSATLPLIPNVSRYNLFSQVIGSGGALTIASGNTLTGASLFVADGGSLAAMGVTFANELVLGEGSSGIVVYSRFVYPSGNRFDNESSAIVTNNDFSASLAASQGRQIFGPVDLSRNYWGTTDPVLIDQNKIYDGTDNVNSPFIDYSSPLEAPPVPPADALQRQVYRLPVATFDGAGNDIELWLGDVTAGQQVQIFAGQTEQDLRLVETRSASGSPWRFSINIHGAIPALAQANYVAIGSDAPVIILSAVGLYPNPNNLSGGGFQGLPANPGSEPTPTEIVYSSVAHLYLWDGDEFGLSPLQQEVWSTLDWSKPTIIVTHGWNDWYRSDFISTFAHEFTVSRTTDELNDFNILALDWSGRSNPELTLLDSDPNDNPWYVDIASGPLGWRDANVSARNGAAIGKSFARVLVDELRDDNVPFSPGNLMLIGHSNGAGLMASMAMEIGSLTGTRIAELAALDAPHTSLVSLPWNLVRQAAAYTKAVENYYMPGAFGFGSPIDNISNVRNFNLNYLRIAAPGWDVVAHSAVAKRYATTANANADWGFQNSWFLNEVDHQPYPYSSSLYWAESILGDFYVPGRLGLLDGNAILSATQAAYRDAIGTVSSFWNSVTGNISQALTGLGSTLWTLGGNTGLIHFRAQSPVHASFNVSVPANADLLTFNLSVANPGNDDHVLVMIGNEVIRDISLASAQSAGGVTEQIWVKDLAGTSQTITFYMPSDEASSAEFSIGDLNFVALDLPPVALVNPESGAIDNASITFTVTYSDPDGSILYSTIGADDVLVTGPNGFSQVAALVTVDQSADGPVRSATYRVTAPNGTWTSADIGEYTAWMQPQQVSDDTGNYVAAGLLDIFKLLNVDSFQVTAFETTASGFVAQFNGDLNASVLNLYTTTPGGPGVRDVTLVGATVGPVSGSLVVDSSMRTITFIKTGGLLAPDNYTVTLRSAADGFADTLGNLLDGNADGTAGDNYVQSFTVAAPPAGTVTVSLPDFTRGPGQPVAVPATGTGIPLALSNTAGVTSFTAQIAYDLALLHITAAAVAPGLPAGATASINTTTTPGVATVTFSSPTPLSAGATTIVLLQADVPSTAAYKSTQVLKLQGLSINNGAIAAAADDALQVVNYFGDANGDQRYTGFDASRISRVVVGLDTGFLASPKIDPAVIADINTDGSLTGFDASRVSRAAVGLHVPQIPALPAAPLSTANLSNKTPVENNAKEASGGMAPSAALVSRKSLMAARDAVFASYRSQSARPELARILDELFPMPGRRKTLV